MSRGVVVTGVGLALPSLPEQIALLEPGPTVRNGFPPEARLGSRGLRYKDAATTMALAAARDALEDAGLPVSAGEQLEPDRLGVVASSNFGTLETVCRVVDSIHQAGVRAASVLDLPNASSNVVASSIAIRFGCRAINLMLCDGVTSGVDALHVAANAIRSKRADRLVVAGVEPSNPVVSRLLDDSARAAGHASRAPGEAGAAVVLESAPAADARGVRPYAWLGSYTSAAAPAIALPARSTCEADSEIPDLWLLPSVTDPRVATTLTALVEQWRERARLLTLDVNAQLGECYGALGVLQAVAASAWLRHTGTGWALATNGPAWGDGSASLELHAMEPSA
jgi:3-oxoacyl-[acyl-carrier-protein] synthase II